jgi:hypothetical protein
MQKKVIAGGYPPAFGVSEQREQGAEEYHKEQTDQESYQPSHDDVAYLLLVDNREYDHGYDDGDESGEYTEHVRYQQSYDESDQGRRIAQVEAFLLCHFIPSFGTCTDSAFPDHGIAVNGYGTDSSLMKVIDGSPHPSVKPYLSDGA